MPRLLVLFTRYPEPGTVKTRLIPSLGAADAARLHREMTERTLARVMALPAALANSPLATDEARGCLPWAVEIRHTGGDLERMRAWLPSGTRCREQGPGDLGERLWRAFTDGFSGGAAAVAAIGADCPDMGAGDVVDAFRALLSHDAVFGPAADGGYWLVGLRRAALPAAAELFRSLDWGGGEVLAASLAAAERSRLSVGLLRTLADVDLPGDLASWERARRGDAAGETVSVVVPALDEEQRIGALVNSLRESPGVEVIVADGGSVDGTVEWALAAGARVVRSPRGRPQQMNAGAAVATGEILFFLHADTLPPTDWAESVRALLRDRAVAAGAFTFRTDSRSVSLRLIEAAANWRGHALGVVFGDQGLFVRRETFDAVGGFPVQPLLEDYEIVRRLRRWGRVVLLPLRAVTSARRWEARGPWRNSLRNACITLAYVLGVPAERLARCYRGRDAPAADGPSSQEGTSGNRDASRA